MTFEEDLSVFFEDFGVEAAWGETSGRFLLRSPQELVFGEVIQADAPVGVWPTTQWSGITKGDRITADDGRIWALTEPPRILNDGALCQAALRKVQ